MSTPVQLPYEQPDPMRPAPLLRELQARGPIHAVRTPVGDPGWQVTGYAEVRRLLNDDRLGRAHREPERASRTGESVMFGGPLGDFDTEQDDHRRMRALLQPHFSPKRMRALRAHVETLTTTLLDELDATGPPADLHTALALPLPIMVICELLGVPYEDRTRFCAWSQAAGDITDRARSEQGLAELLGYVRRLVARKRAEGGLEADVISQLAATEGVGDDEAAALGVLLLFAGYETTVAAIDAGVLWLLATPGQWQKLVADPSRIGAAVEEILRAPALGGDGIPRYARTDLEIAGVQVRAGDLVLLDNGAANHDAAVFADPDRFDVDRATVPHLTFGHGARYCIGAPLARIELQVAFSRLVSRFPTVKLGCAPEELTFDANVLTGGLTALPVSW
ncbi:cytochrome P450 [Streptosporangium algeriense]|uniref:Cytochrome P450 n=1 Tax=Streptosporangium algeriense TaxID=1682748 RepID=A0ABW3DM68_9ACTN